MKPTSLYRFTALAVMSASLFLACKKGAEEAKPAASQPAENAATGPATDSAAADTSMTASEAVPPPSTAKSPKMDFSIPLEPISNPKLDFQAYRGKRLLIFYFGPTCSHCQDATPVVQAFAAGILAKGVETIAIANGRSNPKEIGEYISTYKVKLPVFWDPDRKFGEPYNVTALPTFYAVGKTGEVFRLDEYSGKASLDSLIANI
ncbi:MAG: TlpA disulfide reductase family protein [Fibrobacteria bacterium]